MSHDRNNSDLQAFLTKEVQAFSDADPDVLAQYIMALITTGDSFDVMKESLMEKLAEFFEDQTTTFVNRLMAKLREDSGEVAEKPRDPPSLPVESRTVIEYSDDEDDGDRNFKHRRQRSEFREDYRARPREQERNKRRYMGHGQEGNYNKFFRGDDYPQRGFNAHTAIPVGPAAMYNGYQPYDGRGRGRGGRGRDGMMHGGGRGYMRPRCRDYNERGFCTRGDMCPYDHGADRIIIDEPTAPFSPQFPPGAPPMAAMAGRGMQPPFFGMPVAGSDAYDPERAALGQFPMDVAPPMMAPDVMPAPMMNMRGGMRGRGGRGRGRGGALGGHAPPHKQLTTLVVDNLPPEVCQISKINDYFKRFGTITNITVQFPKATLQFSTRAEAEAAYNSPESIFDNRFIKVYWYKEDSANNAPATTEIKSAVPEPVKNEPDPDAIAARAAELARIREEKQKKHQERMKAILELQKQKEQLLQRQIDEQKALLAKLSDSNNMTQAEKAELLKALKKIAADIDTSKAGVASTAQQQTEAAQDQETESPEDLKKKLALLEAEAAVLGLTDTLSAQGGGFRGGRGGYPVRGRGWPRMRGGMTRMSLDHRPTKVLVKDIPENCEQDLRRHFEQYGNVLSFEPQQDGTVVHYSQRFEAEKAMAVGAHFPHGKLQLSWYSDRKPDSQQQQETSTA
ncbi:uncharacterized protein BYT42DRAFT_563451 [Radiomyces spectabilis]|uniref:uncharacterized protein n=1 Tax=Radiomyces spectabilis TaxID=64574 RepID=UPI00221E6762|nr:uncharacterized protein BYT42DRAFT_563451 [Radiomyces spectabilis]KAI8384722.1 hypothetical protein BYT42DRAFT_563451 [Radiomyces spectabilis]